MQSVKLNTNGRDLAVLLPILCATLHASVVEWVAPSASLYARSTEQKHLCFLVKAPVRAGLCAWHTG